MVKRGIGAVVLAIIAALLLGYLLKDKSRERQEVVKMDLPGITSESKIPSLSATADDTGSVVTDDGTGNLADNAVDTAKSAGATVVAAAAGATTAVATTASEVADKADKAKATVGQAVTPATSVAGNGNTMMRPGFSIRPAAPGEQRDSIDPSGGGNTTAQAKAPRKRSTAGSSKKSTSSASHKTRSNVVASTSGAPKETYRPRLIKERKTRIVSSAQGSNRSKESIKKPRTVKHTVITAKKSAIGKKSTAKRSTTAKNSTVKKSKVAKSSASANTASHGGGYAIQLMATASASRAKKLAKTMKREGYNTFIMRTKKNNKTLYRVRVRAGKSRNAAIAAQKKMKRRYQKNFFVQNSLVVSN